MSKLEDATQVIVICQPPLLLAAWVKLINAQPRLKVVATYSAFPDIACVVDDGAIAIFWASANRHLNSSLADISYFANRYGVLCLLDTYELPTIIRFLQAGFCGFITAEASVPELASALIATARKEIVLPPSIATRALATLARGEHVEAKPDGLTEREHEVLSLLAQGQTNKEIAQALFLSVRTIEAHLRSIFGKLAVASRTEAALWAVRHGF